MGMNTKVIRDQHDIETTRQVYARETLVIQNCHDCKYTVFGQCAIIMVTDCNNFTLTVDANVRTHVMELWRCNNVTLKVCVRARCSCDMPSTYEACCCFFYFGRLHCTALLYTRCFC